MPNEVVNLMSRALRLTLLEPQIVDSKELHTHVIAVTGTWVKNEHKFSITTEDLRAMARNFAKRKNEMVVVDFEHASEMPEVARGGPVVAAGWIHELTANGYTPHPDSPPQPGSGFRGGDGHALRALIEWTPQAKKMIATGQYRFFSPAIDFHSTDKETGEPQGATLTSGALTNHPFLEELPAITLSDGDKTKIENRNSKIDGEFPISNFEFRDEGGTMKKFTLKKLEGGEHAGHHGVFDGEDQVGYIPSDDFEGYAKKYLEASCHSDVGAGSAPSVDGEAEGLPYQLCDLGGREGEQADTIKRLVELGRETERGRARTASRSVLLAECLRAPSEVGAPIKSGPLLDAEKAKVLLRAGKISAEDFIEAHDTAQFIEQVVQEGRVLPKDRAAAFKIALSSADYREFLKTAPRVVLLGSVGLGTGTTISVDDEVGAKVREVQEKNTKLTYGEAFTQVLASDTALAQRYHQAHRREVGAGGANA